MEQLKVLTVFRGLREKNWMEKYQLGQWKILNQLKIANFPKLPDDIVVDLSSDQYYGYRICLAVMSGYLDPDLQKLQIGPILKMADFGLPHSSFVYINKTVFKKFGAIDKFLFENLLSNLVQY